MAQVKEFPILYTLTSKKATRYWKVKASSDTDGSAYVEKEYGQLEGKAIINKKQILDAKGKPSLLHKAILDATSAWEDMKNSKGYVEDVNLLTSTESQLMGKMKAPLILKQKLTIKIQDSNQSTSLNEKKTLSLKAKNDYAKYQSFKFLPMLANKFKERKSYIKYPCFGQAKLDGVRHTCRKISSNEVILNTRNDAICPFFFEIKSALAALNIGPGVFIDGEFYSNKIPFKTLNGYCNRKKMDGKTGYDKIPKNHLESIHYYIFDCYFAEEPNKSYKDRYKYLEELIKDNTSEYLKLVKNEIITDEKEMQPFHDKFITEGYEGLMVRNLDSVYKLKDRSNDLLKYKEFVDMEFIIVNADCPKEGKEIGCLIWTLSVPGTDLTFTCRPRGSYESRKKDWIEFSEDPSQFIGKHYTVRFQEKYDNGVPRFPVGIAVRYDL